ncbi:MAG: glycosyltransferase [Stygiobacter sp.]
MSCQKSPILSICVPTYNRAYYLKECLDSVIESAIGTYDDIEIVISDNASTDNTQEIVENYINNYNFIFYKRNKTNVIDENFFIAASLAKGEYIWIFADDDKMEKSAISSVLKYIKQDYNLIICNYSLWDKNFKSIYKKKFYSVSNNVEFNNHNEILREFGNKLQFLSSIVVKKTTFFNLAEDEYDALHEYGISFAYSLYCGIVKNVKAVLIAEPLLKYRGNNSPITDTKIWYKYFATGSTLLINKLKNKGYSRNAVYSAKNIVLKQYILHDISLRKRNGEILSGIFKLIYPYYKNQLLFWIIAVPMLFSPKLILVIANKIVISLKQVRGFLLFKSIRE